MNSKQKILDEATKLIHTKGFNNTSIQDILDATSVTKSNFYYHFDSKEKLGFNVLQERIRQFTDIIIEPSIGNTKLTSLERISGFLDKILALAAMPEGELGCPFGNLAQEMSAIHEPLRKSLSEFFTLCVDRLEGCFEDGKRAGELRADLPSREIAEFGLAQLQGAFLLRKTHKDIGIMERNVEMLRQSINMWAQPVSSSN
jgi:TetR/AcrR family transcriptional repressor of nem operon